MGYFDSWDWCFFHLQQMRALPPVMVYPSLPRLFDFGEQGITKGGGVCVPRTYLRAFGRRDDAPSPSLLRHASRELARNRCRCPWIAPPSGTLERNLET